MKSRILKFQDYYVQEKTDFGPGRNPNFDTFIKMEKIFISSVQPTAQLITVASFLHVNERF